MEPVKKLNENELQSVIGGTDPEIHVDIKTLDGDDDPYMIPLSPDSVYEHLEKYNKEKPL